MQRLRIKFSRGEEIKYISHLDIVRLWERAFRRARIPVAYSEGFNPHPRVSLAAPLQLGVTSRAELMDIFTSRTISPHWFTQAMGQQLSAGIEILGVFQIAPNLPSLQSQVSFAEYEVCAATDRGKEAVGSSIKELLGKDCLPWHHHRDTGQRNYDLRKLIEKLWLVEYDNVTCTLGMKVRCGSQGSGRPEQVMRALGFTDTPQAIHRNQLILETAKRG